MTSTVTDFAATRKVIESDMARRASRLAFQPSMYRWEFEQDSRVITLDVPGQLTLDDPSLTLEAALAGIGLAYLAEWRISESVHEGKLRRVLDGFVPPRAGLCLYYSSRRYHPPDCAP